MLLFDSTHPRDDSFLYTADFEGWKYVQYVHHMIFFSDPYSNNTFSLSQNTKCQLTLIPV